MTKQSKLFKIMLLLALVPILLITFTSCAFDKKENTLYQVALLQSLMQGEYDGIITVKELKTYGDTGIGTFQSVNGELIMLDGVVYQALGDGTIAVANNNTTIPFANVVFMQHEFRQTFTNVDSMNTLKTKLDEFVTGKNQENQFFMVKLTGVATTIKVRSEIAQEEPYRPLNEALQEDQREFNYENIEGTIVGLYCPNYMAGLNSQGWHFHFISKDKDKGGHMLDCNFEQLSGSLDSIQSFRMIIPNRTSFNEKDLSTDMQNEIEDVEG